MAFDAGVEKNSRTWQDAVQSFLSTLGPTERAAFRAPANPDDCMAVLMATQRRKNKLTRILDLMKPAIDPLKRFESAIDVIVQVNAGIASPIWGPLRIVVTLSADHFRTLESIAMIIHRIISSLQRFSKYEELFEKNRLVQDAIGALYCDYLDFCVRVTRFYSSSFRSFFASFDKDFREISDSIQLHSQNADWAAHAAHIEETQREIEKARAERQVHERGNIQRWLSPATVDDDLQKHLSEYLPGSYDKLLAAEQFQSFISSDEIKRPHVVLQGMPGSGKTTASAFMIDHLKSQGFEVLYFFFKASDVEKCTMLSCLRTILAQLLRLEEHLYDLVEPVYHASGRVIADSLIEVRRALSTALENSTANRIFVLFDALDESSDTEEVLKWIASQGSTAGGQLRIISTSRPSLSFRSMSSGMYWNFLRMEGFENNSIKRYIHSRVKNNPIISGTDIGKRVTDFIALAANGLWLYARLMMDDIDRLPSVGQIQKQLNVLPRGFTELYTQIIRTTEAEFNPIELRLAQQLHLWIDVTDYLPHVVWGGGWLRNDMLELIFQYANDGEAVHDPARQVSRVSGPLLEVLNADATSVGLPIYEVDFIHHTAAQYLKESSNLPAAQLPLTLRPRRIRQLHRAAVAIWYYTECKQSEVLLEALRENEGRYMHSRLNYFEMAYGLWNALKLVEFPEIQDPEEAREAALVLRKLTDFISTPACLRWIESAILINYRGRFPHLLWNAVASWQAARMVEYHPFEPYAAFSKARMRFCHHYVFVLAATGVGIESAPAELLKVDQNVFAQDELARGILRLGKRWGSLVSSKSCDVDLDLP
ncbi:hypothetical protein F4818DRAFT_450045 [Hypoxylon cercidicola]|nr:hypothetical protein F4818DRAFT_450045 [Hypoxylon cercidicola]